jgi:hypothetical protein
VLGWGVGGIEALSVMLGQPIVMVLPEVVGVELKNAMPTGVMATDLVLRVVQMLREECATYLFNHFPTPSPLPHSLPHFLLQPLRTAVLLLTQSTVVCVCHAVQHSTSPTYLNVVEVSALQPNLPPSGVHDAPRQVGPFVFHLCCFCYIPPLNTCGPEERVLSPRVTGALWANSSSFSARGWLA